MRARKWLITLWKNVIDKDSGEEITNDFDEYVKILESRYNGIMYIIHDKETDNNTHIHIFISHSNPIDFNTLKNINKYAHIEEALGNIKQVHKYLCHMDSKSKRENKIEYNPEDIKGNINIFTDTNIFELIENGANMFEIVKENPDLLRYTKNIRELIEDYKINNFKKLTKEEEN